MIMALSIPSTLREYGIGLWAWQNVLELAVNPGGETDSIFAYAGRFWGMLHDGFYDLQN
jgi:hypothetical protein